MSVNELQLCSIIKGSFDSGLLIDETGIILYSNDNAKKLLSSQQKGVDYRCDVGDHIRTYLSFAIPDIIREQGSEVSSDGSNSNDGSSTDLPWDRVMNIILDDEVNSLQISEWKARYTKKNEGEKNTTLWFKVKITVMPSLEEEERINFILFLKPVNKGSLNRLPAEKDRPKPHFMLPSVFGMMEPSNSRTSSLAETSPSTNGEEMTSASVTAMSLQQKDNLILALVESSVDPIFQINEKGIIQMVNKAAVIEFGWRRSEFLGKNISMIAGGDHQKHHDKYIQNYLKTGESKVIGKRRELTARRKNGTSFPIELAVGEVETFDGEEKLFCGFVRNITDIKQNNSLSVGIIEASLDPMLVINNRGIIKMVNNAAIAQFGWSRDEFVGNDICKMIATTDNRLGLKAFVPTDISNYIKVPSSLKKAFQSKRNTKSKFSKLMQHKREMVVRRKNGSTFPIELGVSEIQTFNGEELFCETVHDLTRIKQEENLRVSLIEASLDPMFHIDKNGIIQLVNSAAVKKFGWTREEFIGSNIKIICGGNHGKNHDEYMKRFFETGETRVMGMKRELPARKKDGSEFYIELGVVEVDNFGERQFCGYVHDLTDAKKKRRYAMGIISAALDPLFQIDEDGLIQMINQAAIDLFGYSKKEFLGNNISMVCGGTHGAHHDHYIQRYLKTGVTKVIGKKRELPARKKDGSEFLIELGVAEILTEEGETRLFCGFVRDLSHAKQKERLSDGLLESSMDPIFQINEFGIIKIVNKAAEEVFGWTRDEFVGSNISMITGSEHAEKHDSYIQQYLGTGKAGVIGKKRRLPARKKDGSSFWIELGVVQIYTEEGAERLFVGYVRDLTNVEKKGRLSAEVIEGAYIDASDTKKISVNGQNNDENFVSNVVEAEKSSAGFDEERHHGECKMQEAMKQQSERMDRLEENLTDAKKEFRSFIKDMNTKFAALYNRSGSNRSLTSKDPESETQ